VSDRDPRANPQSRAEVMKALIRRLHEQGVLPRDKFEELEHRGLWVEEPLDQVLLREGLVDERTVLAALSEITGIPVRSIGRAPADPSAVARVPPKAVATCGVMPLELADGVVTLATDRVRDAAEEEQLRVLLGYPVRWVLCTATELRECIKHYYGVGLESFLSIHSGAAKPRNGEAGPDEDPGVPAFVREIILDAIRCGATDVHMEPQEERFRVRYRIDGVLNDAPLPQGVERYMRAVISSAKVLAQMNVAEKRLPQDGRFDLQYDDKLYDLRVSVLPSRLGETVNLRILNRASDFLRLDQLGLSESQRHDLESLVTLPYGIVLFTGPTGSGKTTSLYATLAHLNRGERKIITLEDPVEYQIRGITQIQVETGIGLTFSSGLRSILRHDPNIVLVGEIRDEETADIAVRASLTGHLVFSTLHTNDSASSVARLIDMGVEPYLVASSLQGVVAQRLMRKVCPSCREERTLDPALMPELQRYFPEATEPPRVWQGAGCPNCRFTGYRGRMPIFEILEIDDALRPMIIERSPSAGILRHAVASGLVTLRRRGWDAVLSGLTSVEELMRVTRRTRE
jgi:type II secretory ATPase GspE/PulE/Tfp pilus assembly ATPase PilB-like protein